jgi:hypothetical protein
MLDLSTFLIQGRGSVSDEPGFWNINFDLQTPAHDKQPVR